MKQYDVDKIEDLFNDLDENEINLLTNVLNRIDRLEVDPKTGDPKWSSDEMDVIARFTELEGTEIVAEAEPDGDVEDEPDGDTDPEDELVAEAPSI